MLRPSSLSALLATVVSSDVRDGSIKPHTAVLALPESAEVYAFSTVHDVGASTSAAGTLASLSLEDEYFGESSGGASGISIGSSSAGSEHVRRFTKGLMVEHQAPSLSVEDASSTNLIDSLLGEERIQALATVATMAWREEMERIHAFQRQNSRIARSASGSTAAGSARGGRSRATTMKGKERSSESSRGDVGAEGKHQESTPIAAAKGPTVAMPGTRIVQPMEQADGAGSGLVPLLIECELGPILVMPLVASTAAAAQQSASRKAGPGSSKAGAPTSPPTPPSVDGELESPATPVMLLILNCNPAGQQEDAEESLLASASPAAPGSVDPDLQMEMLKTTASPESPTGTFRRLMRRTPSESVPSPKLEDQQTAAVAGKTPATPTSSSGKSAVKPVEAPDETKLWTSLYATAKAVTRVITPALAACGPALRSVSGSSGL